MAQTQCLPVQLPLLPTQGRQTCAMQQGWTYSSYVVASVRITELYFGAGVLLQPSAPADTPGVWHVGRVRCQESRHHSLPGKLTNGSLPLPDFE